MEASSSATDFGTHTSPRFQKKRKMLNVQSESEETASKEPVAGMRKQNKRRMSKEEHSNAKKKEKKKKK